MAEGYDPYFISTVVLAAIIVAVGIAFLMKDRVASLSGIQSPDVGPFQVFSYMMVLFIPHILILFGPVADALAKDFRYTIPASVGFFSIFGNYYLGRIIRKIADYWNKGSQVAPPPMMGGAAGEGCHVPGFEGFVSEWSSAPLVVTATIMFYYLIDNAQNRGFFNSLPTVLATFSFILSQYWVLKSNGCFASFSNVAYPLLTSVAIGLLFGGGVYGIVQSVTPDRLPSYTAVTAGRNAVASPSAGPSKGSGGGKGGGCAYGDASCSAPADDDQFVCDTYINGMPQNG